MPFILRDGARLYWRVDGRPEAPALLLGNSLGTDHSLWDAVMPALTRRFRVIRFDKRGHGASDVPPGRTEWTIEDLARDALAVADAAAAPRFAYLGISIGGMIGLWLGAHAPERIERLVLSNTAASLPREPWAERIDAVRRLGMAGLADAILQRWFTDAWRASADVQLATIRTHFLQVDPAGYIGCCAAIRDMELQDAPARLRAPVLVLTGTHDVSTPKALGEAIAAQAPDAACVELPVAHIPHPEQPERFLAAVLRFLLREAQPAGAGQAGTSAAAGPDAAADDAPAGSEQARWQAGMQRRRAMLGGAHVEAATARATPLTEEFQQLITRYAWGEIWTRPGLDAPTRRLLVLAQMVALGRWEEFRLHVRAGLAHELSEAELKELLLQSAIYCGVPAANTAFHHAQELVEACRGAAGPAS